MNGFICCIIGKDCCLNNTTVAGKPVCNSLFNGDIMICCAVYFNILGCERASACCGCGCDCDAAYRLAVINRCFALYGGNFIII